MTAQTVVRRYNVGVHLPVLNAEPVAFAELVEIQLGHMCNNRCVFCSSGQATQRGQALPMELQPVLAALERAKRQRARKVTFLGGEPTLQRAFIPALRRATDLGFEEVEIFTNGVKAARRSFVDEVAAIGRFSWRFSIQGGNAHAHDDAVVKPGAFERICRAMENVRAHRHRITANACINERSYRSLPDYVELVRRYGVEQLHIDVVRPSSAGQRTDAYLGEIMPRHVDMAPYVDEMLAAFEAWDPSFDVNVGNYPYCLLPQWSHRIHHGGLETLTLASDLDNDLSEKNKYAAQHSDKLHGPRCRACAFETSCSGVFDAYARIHGTDELRPVTVGAWAVLDQSGERSHLLERGRALAKRLEEPPDSLRVIEGCVAFEHRGVRLRLGPRGTLGLAVARIDTFDVSIEPIRSMSDREATVWIDAVRDLDAWTTAPRAVWVASMMGEAHVERGRRAIATLLKTGERGTRHEPDEQWPGVRLFDAWGGTRRVSIAWPGGPRLLERS